MACERIGLLSVGAVGIAAMLSAQTLRPTFEVASIKKLDQPAPFSPTRTPPRSAAFYRANATVSSLIQFAYNIRDFELIGGPDWMRRDQFEINARAAAEVPIDEMRAMLQSLLEDRFHLVVRKEQREMRFSALVLARDDGRLGPGLTECNVDVAPKPVRVPPAGTSSYVTCASISAVANLAAAVLRMPVVDKTGLTGLWNHHIVFEANPSVSAASAGSQRPVVDSDVPSFPTALQEQLGLKLESSRGPVDVLVIDSVQQPTGN